MIVALPFGIVVGLVIGAVGAGGSILAIPVLVHLAGLDAHAATTASLVIVGTTAALGSVPHWRAGRVRVGAGLTFGAVGAGGAAVGSWINQALSEDLLLVGFSTLALAMAVLLARHVVTPVTGAPGAPGAPTGPGEPGEPGGPGEPGERSRLPRGRLVALGTAVGLLTGLFGVGGGFVVVPALIVLLGFPTRDAVGTSLVVITVNTAVAMAARLPEPAIDWGVVGPFLATAVAGALLGSVVARRTRPGHLAFGLVGLLVVVAGVTGLPAASHLVAS